MSEDWQRLFEFSKAATGRDVPQGRIYIDETYEGLMRFQIVGGPDDGFVVLVDPEDKEEDA